jgi:alkaline phosphatase D
MTIADDYGQFAPPDAFENGSKFAYYGSENQWSRRQFEASKLDEQPNRLGQRLVLAIQEGKPELAAQWCEEYLAQDPSQQEALFALAIAQAQLGRLKPAFDTMRKAIAGGLPFERFMAGPRDLLAPLTSTQDFQRYLANYPVRLVHGPMLGAMTDSSVRVWVRTLEESDIAVRVYRATDMHENAKPVATSSAKTAKPMDYTGVVEISGLQPSTKYRYDVLSGGKMLLGANRPEFETFPKPGLGRKVRVAFGGCAAYIPENERMWDTIASFHPLAMLMIGDNVYIDLPEEARALHRYTYYQRQSRPEFRRLTQSVPIYSIWDDHDAAIDDVWLGPHRDRPAWKPSMLQLQKENWNNPSYGDAEWPGCWYKFSIGDVDFFMLDCRYYRTNPFAAERTMLGPVQKQWLLTELSKSKATFKVLASAVAWADGAKPGSRDTWEGFPEEREEILSLIDQAAIDGIVLLSADRHRSDIRKIPRPKGYPLYDLMNSRLTNFHTHGFEPGAVFEYNEKCTFGLLTFDTSEPDAQMVYETINIDGESVHSLKLSKQALSHSNS